MSAVLLLNILVLGAWTYFLFKLRTYCLESGLKVRGILKQVYQQRVAWSAPVHHFFYLTFLLGISSWLLVSVITFKTDHSFWIVLYPILLWYFTSRYFLWDKEDLRELP